jgi:folate-binding protein YgfZ
VRPGAATGGRTAAPAASFVPWGGAEPRRQAACDLVATFGELEAEYAAIRKGAGLMDCPHRGTLLLSGRDRRDFLNRMLTQDLRDLGPGRARSAFLLNRKGRIEADLLVIDLEDRTLLALDIGCGPRTAQALAGFVFTEDVCVEDATEKMHHVALHGPEAIELLGRAAGQPLGLGPGHAAQVTIRGATVIAAWDDATGGPGLEIVTARHDAQTVWDALLEAGDLPAAPLGPPGGGGDRRPRVRPVGWHAFNIARIEAGTPVFGIDFGTENLPHETGLLRERVSFRKGCYLGQEIVARTENLGRPKQALVGLRLRQERQPVSGAAIFDRAGGAGPDARPVGMVTSSAPSPMLGSVPVAFAMVRCDWTEPGTLVLVDAEGEPAEACVCPLRFLPGPGGRDAAR